MCWQGKKSDRRVADKDIEVYKVMLKYGKRYVPYFRSSSMAYEVGKVYNTTMDENVFKKNANSQSVSYCIFQGFHSYSMEKTCIKHKKQRYYASYSGKLQTENLFIIANKGLYGNSIETYCEDKVKEEFENYKWKKKGVLNTKLHFVKCIIPKGSAYYQNHDGVIVSESIIVTGEEIRRKDILKM